MALQQPKSPLDNIPNLQDASEQQKQIEERLSRTYVPRITELIIKDRKRAMAMRRKAIF
ncbi:MAG: hypothetical protein ACAH17_00370 [Candidatus Paceibacterota bacterium]